MSRNNPKNNTTSNSNDNNNDPDFVNRFGYRENSNLVLRNSYRSKQEIGANSEIQSLTAKYSVADLIKDMGSRAGNKNNNSGATTNKRNIHNNSTEAEQTKRIKLSMNPKNDESIYDVFSKQTNNNTNTNDSVLTADTEIKYHPISKETKLIYSTLLAFIQSELNFASRSHSEIQSAADVLLESVKDVNLNPNQKREQIQKLFNLPLLSQDKLNVLLNITNKLTDYENVTGENKQSEETGEYKTMDEEHKGEIDDKFGVSVVFDEEEENNEHNQNGLTGQFTHEIVEDVESEPEDNEIDENAEKPIEIGTTIKREKGLEESEDETIMQDIKPTQPIHNLIE